MWPVPGHKKNKVVSSSMCWRSRLEYLNHRMSFFFTFPKSSNAAARKLVVIPSARGSCKGIGAAARFVSEDTALWQGSRVSHRTDSSGRRTAPVGVTWYKPLSKVLVYVPEKRGIQALLYLDAFASEVELGINCSEGQVFYCDTPSRHVKGLFLFSQLSQRKHTIVYVWKVFFYPYIDNIEKSLQNLVFAFKRQCTILQYIFFYVKFCCDVWLKYPG